MTEADNSLIAFPANMDRIFLRGNCVWKSKVTKNFFRSEPHIFLRREVWEFKIPPLSRLLELIVLLARRQQPTAIAIR